MGVPCFHAGTIAWRKHRGVAPRREDRPRNATIPQKRRGLLCFAGFFRDTI